MFRRRNFSDPWLQRFDWFIDYVGVSWFPPIFAETPVRRMVCAPSKTYYPPQHSSCLLHQFQHFILTFGVFDQSPTLTIIVLNFHLFSFLFAHFSVYTSYNLYFYVFGSRPPPLTMRAGQKMPESGVRIYYLKSILNNSSISFEIRIK